MRAITRYFLRRLSRAARPYLATQGLMRVTKIFNQSALEWQPSNERVVVLAPHMDDEIIGCGGTLARHVAAGSEVTVIFLTDGELGGVATTRKAEARRALQEIGIARMVFLDAKDGHLGSSPHHAAALRAALMAADPEIVYLPFFLEEHPDHRAASTVLSGAVAGSGMNFRCHGYEVWTPLFPNCFVKIDSAIDAKRRALTQYQSQLAEADYLHTSLGLNAYRSSALLDEDCRFAEAFCAVSLAQYLDLFRSYSGEAP